MTTNEDFMLKAFEEAFWGIRNNLGGPFGTVIVSGGIVIGKGCNMVTSLNDPTAHAEIVAIRDACKRTNALHLLDSILFTSCEPCAMCFAAIYWVKIKTVYYCSERSEAARIGFNDKFIYDEFSTPSNKRILKTEQLKLPISTELFIEWSTIKGNHFNK